jgi:hypothetical protein
MSLKLILLLLLWYISGVVSFIYWWTKDYDFEVRGIPVAVFSGLAGPISFIIGAAIHNDSKSSSKIIIKKRNNE